MLRAVALVLAFVVLTGSLADLHELSKLPYLLEHYQQHKDHSKRFSIAEFVSLHYGEQSEQHDKEEHEKHQGLPFKKDDCSSIHSTVFFGTVDVPPREITLNPVLHTNFYQSVFSSDFRQSIWQPPRLIG
ncbi:MAG: hypothetical protein AB7K37_02145 [Cyclobacteriaceae bacterium]